MLTILPLLLTATTYNQTVIDVSAATNLSFSLHTSAAYIQLEEPQESQPIPSRWGDVGSWRWGLQGGYAWDVKNSDNRLTTIGVEFEYFTEEDLSIDIGLLVLDADQVGPNAEGFNFTLQLRWHFIHEATWSMFIEGGAGLLRTSAKVPATGSRFNFTPQAGVGWTFDIGNNNRWLIGARWHHISNANIYETNPGRDSIMIWTGISFPF